MRCFLLMVSIAMPALWAQPAQPACAGLPPGRHSLLERFAEMLSLTCEQQLKVEPILHAEEAVSKPLLAFTAFTPEERGAVMLKLKIAARRQVKSVLNAEQQKRMDAEIASVAASKPSGGKKGGRKTAEVDPFANEEALCRAIREYTGLAPDEKSAMIASVKRAAIREGGLNLTPEQRSKIEADLRGTAGK